MIGDYEEMRKVSQGYSVIDEVAAELQRAQAMHLPVRNAHEGYAVLLEEVDELWDEIKKKEKQWTEIRKEAIQVAAMAIRFVLDVVDFPDAKR